MKTSLKASLIALAIASFPVGSQAAGLGQINVFSGLGQPLRAEISVNATPQELQSLTARIGSPDAFRAANIAYSAAAASVRASLDARSGRPVIRLSSARPINDPFVELLVELNWASGQLARDYTFLLDPVDLSAPKPVAARIEPAAVAPAPKMPAPAPAAVRETERERAPASVAAPDRYTVKRGDTLRSIAGNTAPAGANLDQTLIALFRANPAAFEGGNINRLKAGAVLSIPSADRVQSVTPVEARREILAQAADFDAYRRRLAGAVAERAEPAEAAAEQASGGRIVPKVEEARPAAESKDKVRVSRSEKLGEGDTTTRLQALEEELASREKALQDANARLAQLEQSIRDMQKLLEVRSGALAQAQQQAGGTPRSEAGSSAAPATPAAVAPAPAPAEPPVAQPTPADVAAKSPAADSAPTAKPAEPAPVPAPAAEPRQEPKQTRAEPPPPPPEEPGFVDSLLADPSTLAAGGGAAALLLALVALRLRQRRSKEAVGADESGHAGATQPGEPGTVFGETGGQSVDTGNSMLMTDFSQSGLSAIDTDEGVDPVAEADVYMAYGRDAQAEEILQDAMKADPDRAAIHLKLLEIYAQRKSLKQFEMVAAELYARTGGRGADWERAALMGRKLDPDNPLYGDQVAARTEGLAGAGAVARAAVPAATAAGLAGVAMAAAMASKPTDAEHFTATVPQQEPAEPEIGEGVEELSALDFTASLPVEPAQSQFKDTWTRPGALGQFSDEGEPDAGGAPAAEDGSRGSAAGQLPADGAVIDFDLGLDEPEPAPVATLDSTQDAAQVGEPEDQGLTFDLDIGEPELSAAPVLQAQEIPAAATEVEEGFEEVASAFDFELPDLDLEPSEASTPDLDATMVDAAPLRFEPETTALGMDFESAAEAPDLTGNAAPDLKATFVAPDAPSFDPDATALDLDFDFPDLAGGGIAEPTLERPVAPPPGAEAATRSEMDLEKSSFDPGLLDFDFDIEPASAAASAAVPPSLDLTALDLDLNLLDSAEMAPVDAVRDAAQMAPATSEERPENFEEIETKLELARAYEEMGDKEGALELLDEVLREGGAQQQSVARDMIARLG
ncbi:MAG: LysM peptidoglycan-binding domain-containing protein [Proteobacteria bacterium]|nr:LysM peptidoglycan-binding domain-containing protein [Pseudomonadota bacterium]